MHTPPALYFLHWKFLTPFISLQRTEQTQISPFITTLMLSLFLSNAQGGLSTIPEFLCSASFLFLSNTQDGLRSAHLSQPWCFLYFSPTYRTDLVRFQNFFVVHPFCFSPTHRTDCRRGGCMVGTRCVGVSRWSYLAPEASDGKVLCGHKPQSKPHLSEPGTHQRTWRVMGRPARQKTQTPSMTRRNDRTRHDHAAAPPAVRPSLPPSIPTHKKKSPKKAQKRGVPR